MEQLTKRQKAREEVFALLFETAFNGDKTAEAILADAEEARGIKVDDYVRNTYFGVVAHIDELNADIDEHAVGWKRNRISAVSLAIMQLCIYEMRYSTDIPLRVALNEAILLSKRFDDEKARPFVNGILNAVMQNEKKKRDDEE